MNQRDIELLSSYLDGQISSADSAKLEARLKTNPELDSVLRDLRATRGILKKLPARKAPRNFTLTRQMAGLKPPLPRAYPLFRLATVFASILFIFSFTATALSPMFSLSSSEPMYGFGMGGGCDGPCEDAAMESVPMEAPAAPAAEESAMQESAPADSTTEDGSRNIEPTPVLKEGGEPEAADNAPETATQPEVQPDATVSYFWAAVFFILAFASGLVTWGMRRSAQSKWR